MRSDEMTKEEGRNKRREQDWNPEHCHKKSESQGETKKQVKKE